MAPHPIRGPGRHERGPRTYVRRAVSMRTTLGWCARDRTDVPARWSPCASTCWSPIAASIVLHGGMCESSLSLAGILALALASSSCAAPDDADIPDPRGQPADQLMSVEEALAGGCVDSVFASPSVQNTGGWMKENPGSPTEFRLTGATSYLGYLWCSYGSAVDMVTVATSAPAGFGACESAVNGFSCADYICHGTCIYSVQRANMTCPTASAGPLVGYTQGGRRYQSAPRALVLPSQTAYELSDWWMTGGVGRDGGYVTDPRLHCSYRGALGAVYLLLMQ